VFCLTLWQFLNLVSQNRKFAPLTVQLRNVDPDAARSKPLVKALGVRIGLDFPRSKTQRTRSFDSVVEHMSRETRLLEIQMRKFPSIQLLSRMLRMSDDGRGQ
jgi:hypothetical protein